MANTLRVLVATDCHLGYMEKDEFRRHDSFRAFEEICSIAEQKNVDFVLLGGDLFHENKPSRSTLVKTIEILRRYCLNDRPVQFQVVSDQTINFANVFGLVNYEDPHFNVGMPVFTIHGNHDDPAGVDNLSAIDILSACNLVNYFGKMALEGSGVGQVTLYPILIKKGSTSVALYGLGNIRDERLNRMFQTPHAVQWMRPESQEDCQVSDWFNILVLHQNRVKSNPKNAINEHFLPRFLDFVVWGHEHECLIDPQEAPGMGFHITQPGSSVATSLIDGESKPKHVLLLEIKGNQYRPTKIPLSSVRPFEYAEIVLKDKSEIDPNDQNSIVEHLDRLVGSLIEKSKKKGVTKAELKLPLIRIKVDYSGFMTINPQRFGQKFVGKVANPQDILIFSKSSKRSQNNSAEIDDSERLRPEELNQQNIEALVAESNLKMEILPVNDLDIALHNFVNKDDKMAFYTCVQSNIQETRNKISKDSETIKYEEDDVILKVGQCFDERVKERSVKLKDNKANASNATISLERLDPTATQASFSDYEDLVVASSSKKPPKGAIPFTAKASTSRGKRGRGRGRGRGAGTAAKQTTIEASFDLRRSQRSASSSVNAVSVDHDDDVESLPSSDSHEYSNKEVERSSEDDSVKGKGTKRAAPRGRGRGTPSKRGKKADNSLLHKMLSNKDDDDDDEDDNPSKKLQKAPLRVSRDYGTLRR